MRNRSFRQSAVHHGSVGYYFSLLQYNVIFVGGTRQGNVPRQANSLTELVKPQRQYSECVSTYAL